MSNRGRLAVSTMLVLAIGLVVVGVIYHRNHSQQILAAWGQKQLLIIRSANRAEGTLLSPLPPTIGGPAAGSEHPRLQIGGDDWYPDGWREIATGPGSGFVHLRAALLTDTSFNWSQSATTPIAWSYALRLYDGQRSVLVAVSEQGEWVTLPAADRPLCCRPIAAGLRGFLEAQFHARPWNASASTPPTGKDGVGAADVRGL